MLNHLICEKGPVDGLDGRVPEVDEDLQRVVVEDVDAGEISRQIGKLAVHIWDLLSAKEERRVG